MPCLSSFQRIFPFRSQPGCRSRPAICWVSQSENISSSIPHNPSQKHQVKKLVLGAIVYTVVVSVILLMIRLMRGGHMVFRLGVVNLAVAILSSMGSIGQRVSIAGLVLVVDALFLVVANGSALGTIARTVDVELVWVRVLGEDAALLAHVVLLALQEAAEEAALAAGALGVVVLRAGTIALLSVVIAGKGNFHENREDEEDTSACKWQIYAGVRWKRGFDAYIATTAMAKQAD